MNKPTITLLAILSASTSLFAQDLTVDQLIDKGIQQHDKGDYATAVTYFRKAIDIDSNSDRALYEMANTLINYGKYDQASEYATRTIRKDKHYVDQAYTLKGTALDLMGKPYEALEVYLEALKKYPNNNLLRYNAALTYLDQKRYSDAEYHAAKAVEIEPTHASAHLVLGYAMYYQNKRSQSILSLSYFLMLENNSERSATALNMLNKQISRGVTKDGNNINISLPRTDKVDEFSSADLMLSMQQALNVSEGNKKKTKEELFYKEVQGLFAILGELKDKNKSHDIWWDMYVPFFKKMNDQQLTETMCYYVTASENDPAVSKWLDANKSKTEKLLNMLPQHK